MKQPRKIYARLTNSFEVLLFAQHRVSVWPTLLDAMNEAQDLTYRRNLSAAIVDRETGEALVEYNSGEVTYQAWDVSTN